MDSLPDWEMPADRPVLPDWTTGKENAGFMVILGIDAHKRTHTVVAIDNNGRRLASKTFGTATADHLALLRWADQLDTNEHPTGSELIVSDPRTATDKHRRWAVEDCRHLSRRLERDLLAAGEQLTRVRPS